MNVDHSLDLAFKLPKTWSFARVSNKAIDLCLRAIILLQESAEPQGKASEEAVSSSGPAETSVGQLGVDESAADVSAPDEATRQEAPGAQGSGEAASSAEEAAISDLSSSGADENRGRGRRRSRGFFNDVDEDSPGGVAAFMQVRRRSFCLQPPVRQLFAPQLLQRRCFVTGLQRRTLYMCNAGRWDSRAVHMERIVFA